MLYLILYYLINMKRLRNTDFLIINDIWIKIELNIKTMRKVALRLNLSSRALRLSLHPDSPRIHPLHSQFHLSQAPICYPPHRRLGTILMLNLTCSSHPASSHPASRPPTSRHPTSSHRKRLHTSRSEGVMQVIRL